MSDWYLAVDIGASGGRHILGRLEQERLTLKEVYRFPNGMTGRDGVLCWDTDRLFAHIKEGMRRCAAAGTVPVSMGVDTWGVDFVLLDAAGRRLGPAVAYRDGRTVGMDREVYKHISERELYARTGIQKQPYNTIYQLMALKTRTPSLLEQAGGLCMSPDYYHYLLTGERAEEYTIATTGQLIDPAGRDWDWELIDRLGYPRKLFAPVCQPGTALGRLTKAVQTDVGFDCQVILPPSHDTASAVLAVPLETDGIYISSGTWSLMGVERRAADTSPASWEHNFTNEGGYGGRFRYLKNIMGLWMIQRVRKELGGSYSFSELCSMAERETIRSRVDCYDERFLAPENMTAAIQDYCRRTAQPVPETAGQLAAVIYHSLAQCYADTAKEIETMTGRTYDVIHVVGGGSNAEYLNRLTARCTGKMVLAGPGEATAAGNILCQMIARGELSGLEDARACVRRSFDIRRFPVQL